MVHYGRGHVRNILRGLGVEIVASTEKRFNCLCPFHHNTATPAFSISRGEGVWICFNEACGRTGNLEQLVMALSDRTKMEALRYIGTKQPSEQELLSDLLDQAFAPEPEWPVFPQTVVDELVENFWNSAEAQDYMYGRGFDEATLRRFEVGYSPKMGGEVVYPVHTPNGDLCVGVVGRGLHSKFFDNSKNLPKKRILFNLHMARKTKSSVVVVESGFDAMRIHQAGFPNVVATLGASLGDEQVQLLERNFTDLLVFSDNDDAGMGMRKHISERANKSSVLHCAWDYDTMYPDEAGNRYDGKPPKDAGDLSIEQIQHMVNNPLTSYEVGLP